MTIAVAVRKAETLKTGLLRKTEINLREINQTLKGTGTTSRVIEITNRVETEINHKGTETGLRAIGRRIKPRSHHRTQIKNRQIKKSASGQ